MKSASRSLAPRIPLALILVASISLPALADPAPPRLDPAHTLAVISGVLEWKEPKLTDFSKVGRKDKELFEALGRWGIPEDRRVLLTDGRATAHAVKKALAAAIRRAGPEDSLIFYYAGHGIKTERARVVFATADIAEHHKSGLHLDELAGLFIGHFKGERVLLMADCCYSGGLAEVARALSRAGIEAASLTSAERSNVSTANWTFTQAVIDAFSGRGVCDKDADGAVELGELAAEARESLRYRERQRVGWAPLRVSPELVLAPRAEGESPPQELAPAWVRVSYKHARWPARVLGVERGERLRVSVYDYSHSVELTVSRRRAEPLSFETWPVGTELDVLWKGEPYRAKVLEVEGGFLRITYPGFGAKWDEWVASDRVIGLHVGGATKPREVEVEWKGDWYPAAVTSEKGGKLCVHYLGYDASWDECVPPSRVRGGRTR